ncbi:hypothetical protein ACP4OV_010804 [Aristida adscensionis]
MHAMSSTEESDDDATMSLNDDLIAEIIVRLPLKSAARCRCVSTKWRAAISGDDSLRRRLPLHMSAVYFTDDDGGRRPRVACAAGDRLLEDCDLGFFPFWEAGGAVACDACNGLLLCRSPGTRRLYVVDPVRRRWAALPPPAKDARLSVLAFDPSSSPHYRVVNFTGWPDDRGADVEVFSSAAPAAWAVRSPEFGGVPASALSAGSVHAHGGAVYIVASDDAHSRVVRMEVAGGECACTVVELPEPVGGGGGHVAHSGGRLHYVTTDHGVFRVWALEVEDSSPTRQWRLKHAAMVEDVVNGACTGGNKLVRFLAMHLEKDVVYMWSPPARFVEYDMDKKSSRTWRFGEDQKKGERNRVVIRQGLARPFLVVFVGLIN